MSAARALWSLVVVVVSCALAVLVTSGVFVLSSLALGKHPFLWYGTLLVSAVRFVFAFQYFTSTILAPLDEANALYPCLQRPWMQRLARVECLQCLCTGSAPGHGRMMPIMMLFGHNVIRWAQDWEWAWTACKLPPAPLVAHTLVALLFVFPSVFVPVLWYIVNFWCVQYSCMLLGLCILHFCSLRYLNA